MIHNPGEELVISFAHSVCIDAYSALCQIGNAVIGARSILIQKYPAACGGNKTLGLPKGRSVVLTIVHQ